MQCGGALSTTEGEAEELMARTRAVTVTFSGFRRMDSLSGHMRVGGESRTRRGARRHTRRASCNSPENTAGTDAACGVAAGGSAHTSAAHAASCATDSDLALATAEDAGRAPTIRSKSKARKSPSQKGDKHAPKTDDGGDGPAESLWLERSQMDGGDPLPQDGVGFVDAVNDHIDLVRVTELLLRGFDEKSSKNLLELLLEMKYGKHARAGAAKPQQIADYLPQAIRD